ncbi:unnamed protein product [Owenia fusiformis]|uniref:PA domain-containing protein n=1 Tax=Owenia fusiformis TaxID=6347 RepID=A0A8S4P9S3_OWEFU|nr:unnamed protein product [Owenia fusiformis]
MSFLSTFLYHTQVSGDYGVLNAVGSNGSKQFCIVYNPQFKKLATSAKDAEKLPLLDLTPSPGCSEPTDQGLLKDKAVMVMRGNCTFSEKANIIQNNQGKSAIIISKQILTTPAGNTSSDYDTINISVGLLDYQDFTEIQSLGSGIAVQLYAPEESRVDFNLLLIWVLATGTVIIGAYWSGKTKHKHYLRKGRKSSLPDGASEDEDPDEQETLNVSAKLIIFFVFMMCAMLVLLYFFYDYLVYLIIGVFCLATSISTYSCFQPIVARIPCIQCRIPENNIPLLKERPKVSNLFLGLCCIGLSVWWGIERKASYAWILQNFLGVAFCTNMMKTIRMPNLMGCTILLGLLFFYDIFFVFITPLFTKHGESIMVDVATGAGGTSGEQLPMVLKVPKFSDAALNVCSLPYSLLGFGDILVPGLLVSYCHGFDLKVQSKKIYYITNCIAYGVGLVICFVALAFMEIGQPALLYLVPCGLIPTYIIALIRGEFKHIWTGDRARGKKSDSNSTAQPTEGDTGSSTHNATVQNTDDSRKKDNVSLSSDESDGESAHLIKDK